MNYSSIIKSDIANGIGFRVSLFVSGCARKCPGCFNPESHDPNYGRKFDDEAKSKIFKELDKPYCRGLSILGGDPMSKLSDNRTEVINFTREVKNRYPNKDIWMWTGYTIEEIESDNTMKDVLKYIDVLVDGPFIEEKKDLSIPFRGSTNQRIIKISDYIKNKTV